MWRGPLSRASFYFVCNFIMYSFTSFSTSFKSFWINSLIIGFVSAFIFRSRTDLYPLNISGSVSLSAISLSPFALVFGIFNLAYVEAIVNVYYAETCMSLFITSYAVSASFFHKPLSYRAKRDHKPLASQYVP